MFNLTLPNILKSFRKTLKQLDEFVTVTEQQANYKEGEANKLLTEAVSLQAEADKAIEVRENINALLGGAPNEAS